MRKTAPVRDFFVATQDEIRSGRTTDIYFVRTLDILKKAGKDRTPVVAEATTGGLPNGWPGGVFWGLAGGGGLPRGRGACRRDGGGGSSGAWRRSCPSSGARPSACGRSRRGASSRRGPRGVSRCP